MFYKVTLTMQSPFDYESDTHQNISLVATDNAGEKAYLNISVEVLNVNDPPKVSI